MAPYLLDTDAIIDYLAGVPDTVALLRDLYERGDSLCVCDVIVAEVYSGLRRKDVSAAHKLLAACSFLSTSREAAQQAGEWRYRYARQGIILSTADVMVAATAHAHQATLVTANRGHYPMEGISLHFLPRAE